MHLFLQKIKNFINSDIRWKLRKIGKPLNINIYPIFFYKNGIKSIYSKIVFNLIFSEKLKEIKNYFYKQIFVDRDISKNSNFNLLVSCQRSGGTFTRMMLTSYTELFYKAGNGIPKYDSLNNKWMFSISSIVNGDLFNTIYLERLNLNSNPFNTIEEYEKKKIIFTRYPITPLELYPIEKMKPVVIMRNPYDQITSYYTNHNKKINKSEFDSDLLKKSLKNYLEYFNFWKDHFEKNKEKKNYLLIKHEDLVDTSEKILREILLFYEYEIDEKLISKAAFINSKEQTLKYIGDVKINKIRFTDPKKKEINKEKILFELSKLDQDKNLVENYNNLK